MDKIPSNPKSEILNSKQIPKLQTTDSNQCDLKKEHNESGTLTQFGKLGIGYRLEFSDWNLEFKKYNFALLSVPPRCMVDYALLQC